eukprot:CAMPEP_0171868576 /NCGR_PEP_ID=MMETSP0992-20121227/31499_1 /TAXON_ID=483369 /ORGANISM="non described non described, Strain CCMP2098" /LENGTH=457 /DNA_ID=CAMNT_0012492293 /DNA_START=73 /DNA_END=1443 /DNA_ORIENTATION=-
MKAAILKLAIGVLVGIADVAVCSQLTPIGQLAPLTTLFGFELYQRTKKDTTNPNLVKDFKRYGYMAAKGTIQLGEEIMEVGRSLLQGSPKNFALKQRTDRLTADLVKVAIIVGSQILKQPVLNYAFFAPRAVLPSVYFASENTDDRIETEIHHRLKGLAHLANSLHGGVEMKPFERQIAPFAEAALLILTTTPAPFSPNAVLEATERAMAVGQASSVEPPPPKSNSDKAKNKKEEPLKGLPGPVLKGFRPLATGQLRDLARVDDLLHSEGAEGLASLSRRDLFDLGNRRCLVLDPRDGDEQAQDEAMRSQLKAYLSACYDEEGGNGVARKRGAASASASAAAPASAAQLFLSPEENPLRRRAVLLLRNSVDSARRGNQGTPLRAILRGGDRNAAKLHTSSSPFLKNPPLRKVTLLAAPVAAAGVVTALGRRVSDRSTATAALAPGPLPIGAEAALEE